ncbi:MAG: hypothetical protein LBQ91_02880 [Oscillospiraceae bacterium]|jgi:hypothetical protein|nr:hypothetical protein [Oscillospiraceae bacterium]
MKKKILIPAIAAAAVLLILSGCTKAGDPTASTPPKELKPGITAENYEALIADMSYDEVSTILAAEGESFFERDNAENPEAKWIVYSWTQKTGGAVVYTVFSGDKLTAKAADNLSGVTERQVSLIGYALLEAAMTDGTGMTYEDAKRVIGAEGRQSEPFIVNGKESFTYTWENGTVKFSAMFVGDSLFGQELISL